MQLPRTFKEMKNTCYSKRDKRRAASLQSYLVKYHNSVWDVFMEEMEQTDNPKIQKIERLFDRCKLLAWHLGSGRDSELLLEKAKRLLKRYETKRSLKK